MPTPEQTEGSEAIRTYGPFLQIGPRAYIHYAAIKIIRARTYPTTTGESQTGSEVITDALAVGGEVPHPYVLWTEHTPAEIIEAIKYATTVSEQMVGFERAAGMRRGGVG